MLQKPLSHLAPAYCSSFIAQPSPFLKPLHPSTQSWKQSSRVLRVLCSFMPPLVHASLSGISFTSSSLFDNFTFCPSKIGLVVPSEKFQRYPLSYPSQLYSSPSPKHVHVCMRTGLSVSTKYFYTHFASIIYPVIICSDVMNSELPEKSRYCLFLSLCLQCLATRSLKHSIA